MPVWHQVWPVYPSRCTANRHPLHIPILRAEVEAVKRHPLQILILRGRRRSAIRLTHQSAVGRFICALMVSMKWRIATAAGWPSPGGA